jgi:hypothetical protein
MRALLLVLLMLPFLIVNAQTTTPPTLEFTWVLPTQYEPIGNAAPQPLIRADLSTIQLYDGANSTDPKVAPKLATWPVGTAGSFISTQGGERKYFVTVTSKIGLESAASNVVIVDMRRPGKASNLQVKVNFTATGQ